MGGKRGVTKESRVEASKRFYEVALPILMAAKRVRPVMEAVLMREYRPVDVESSGDSRMWVLSLFPLGKVRPMVVGLYIRVSRNPLWQKRYREIVARLSRFVNTHAPPYRDSYLAIITDVWNPSAFSEFREMRVGIRRVEEAKRDIYKWFARSLTGLGTKVYRSRVFGPLIVNAYLWAMVLAGYTSDTALSMCESIRVEVEQMALSRSGVEAGKFFEWLCRTCTGYGLWELANRVGAFSEPPPPIVEDAVREAEESRPSEPPPASPDSCPEDAYYISGHCFPVVVEGDVENDDDYFYVGGHRFRVRSLE